jgi:hypothetical protein
LARKHRKNSALEFFDQTGVTLPLPSVNFTGSSGLRKAQSCWWSGVRANVALHCNAEPMLVLQRSHEKVGFPSRIT